MSNFNWNDLRFFLAVVRTASPAHAARLLKVNHTTVRRRLQSLEAELGVRLLERRDDRYTMTSEGEALLRSAEAVESLLQRTRAEIGDHERSVCGVVRIGVPDGIGSYFLAPRLARLSTAYPQLTLELVVVSRIFNLSKREADMAIVVARPDRGGQHYVRRLGKVANHLYAARSYLATRPPVSCVQDLVGHEFIGYIAEFDFGTELAAAFGKYGIRYEPKFASTNLVAQLKAANAGGGICMLPAYMIEGRELEPVLHQQFVVEREVWLLTHADLRDVARIRVVADFIVEEFGRARPLLSGHGMQEVHSHQNR